MNKKLFFALLFLVLGMIPVIDWIYYCQVTDNSMEWSLFQKGYFDRFPADVRILFQYNIITIVCIGLFILSGTLFLKLRKRFFRILGIVAFCLAFWQLFSLM